MGKARRRGDRVSKYAGGAVLGIAGCAASEGPVLGPGMRSIRRRWHPFASEIRGRRVDGMRACRQ